MSDTKIFASIVDDVTKQQVRALEIKGKSISSNPRIVELEWISKWNGQLPTYMLGQNQSVMLGLSK